MTWLPAASSQVTVRLEEHTTTIDREIAKLLWRYADPKTQAEHYNCIALQPVPPCVKFYLPPEVKAVLVSTDGFRLVVTPAYGVALQGDKTFSPSFLRELKAWTKRHKKEAPVEVRATASDVVFPAWANIMPGISDTIEIEIDSHAAKTLAAFRGSDKYMTKDVLDYIIFAPDGAPAFRHNGDNDFVAVDGVLMLRGTEPCRISTTFIGEIAQLWPEGFTLESGGPLAPFIAIPSYAEAPAAFMIVMPQRAD